MTEQPTLRIQTLPHCAGLPEYKTSGAAGMDLRASNEDPITIFPLSRCLIPTGIKIALPTNYEMQIRPRSGLALNHGIIIPNTPGTIDEDFRGEVQVILMNLGTKEFVVERGMAIAQGVVAPVRQVSIEVVTELDETERGEGGFGSTGVSG